MLKAYRNRKSPHFCKDKELTRTLVKAGDILGIQDHIILGGGRYFSFKESGLL
ncbi:MAG: JAB domain-containing protein [bacterium]